MDMNQIESFATLVLTWIGFGTIVGLAAKGLMPGRDPGGAVATLLMGVAGSVIGCALLKFLHRGVDVSPISLLGFCVGTGGAFIILAFYKILGGYWFVEGEHVTRRHIRRRRSGRRAARYDSAHIDD